MYGQTGVGKGVFGESASRMYCIEVEGMQQKVDPDRVSYRIRNSGTTYIKVPYNRLSEQMQRINRLGGKIVNIMPLTMEGDSEAKMKATTTYQILNAGGKPKSTGADEE
ncbi:phycobilisome linker polypeptide [Oscillatoria salina]|uniref:phycobilisome linker polypeptide n=1 Tax=Oscillatoria salina TaxID=331517 RepID=UPI001CCF4715|nr:phycobilisome linker polypeptide [Oscillatoria salina]MBZ8181036.1 CpcD phycobilisome linker protein [Oscillatoria salina IIICB1]